MERVHLACGCEAHAKRTMPDGSRVPSCVIHDCIEPASVEPDLAGREARCHCGQTRPSDGSGGPLAFFEYRGPGSRTAYDVCAHCGCYACAHDPEYMQRNVPTNRKTVVEQGRCPGFEARGPHDFDLFYCGCRGWD